MKVSQSQKLYEQMKEGRVYRREELTAFSKSLDRELKELVKDKRVTKAAAGLYYRPKMSRFGPLSPKSTDLVRAFLKTDDFLLTTLNVFNGLGVGLTQMVNEYVVYNRKRHGKFKLDGLTYYFKRPPNFPKKNEVSDEYLFVDLLNNYDELPDPPDDLWDSLQAKVREFPHKKLERLSDRYGKASTKKLLKELTANA
ncbi:MAG: hypothetical protein J5J00_02605 [Deltaproteobacteria bacterium]|nr:hypothetical protein [Deltaproteobacteria bacterium]